MNIDDRSYLLTFLFVCLIILSEECTKKIKKTDYSFRIAVIYLLNGGLFAGVACLTQKIMPLATILSTNNPLEKWGMLVEYYLVFYASVLFSILYLICAFFTDFDMKLKVLADRLDRWNNRKP